MSIVEFIAIAVIAAIVLSFAVVLVTEASQRRELRQLRIAALKAAPSVAAKLRARGARPYRTI
jgi:hypothetical protein